MEEVKALASPGITSGKFSSISSRVGMSGRSKKVKAKS